VAGGVGQGGDADQLLPALVRGQGFEVPGAIGRDARHCVRPGVRPVRFRPSGRFRPRKIGLHGAQTV
jgi:hypothetical protein